MVAEPRCSWALFDSSSVSVAGFLTPELARLVFAGTLLGCQDYNRLPLHWLHFAKTRRNQTTER